MTDKENIQKIRKYMSDMFTMLSSKTDDELVDTLIESHATLRGKE